MIYAPGELLLFVLLSPLDLCLAICHLSLVDGYIFRHRGVLISEAIDFAHQGLSSTRRCRGSQQPLLLSNPFEELSGIFLRLDQMLLFPLQRLPAYGQ